MISAQIIADSINEYGGRVTTMLVTIPRIILAEFNTHRAFSRNTSSSRAIPFEKMVKAVRENPFYPIAWQKNHKGMQGTEYFTSDEDIALLETNWGSGMEAAIRQSQYLIDNGATKQIANRLLEPFSWTKVVVTSTEWENFFTLRCPQYTWQNSISFRSWRDLVKESFDRGANRDWVDGLEDMDSLARLRSNAGQAEIHMMALAEAMWDAYNESQPKLLKAGEWHIPYSGHTLGDDFDKVVAEYYGKEWEQDSERWTLPCNTWEEYELFKVKVATVKCARTSYTVVGEDQKPLSYKRMIEIHDNLLKASPVHASPFEHCAQNSLSPDYSSRNFTGGWKQYREILGI